MAPHPESEAQRVGPHPFGIPRGGAERALLASA
jgi:hypothetical protein